MKWLGYESVSQFEIHKLVVQLLVLSITNFIAYQIDQKLINGQQMNQSIEG